MDARGIFEDEKQAVNKPLVPTPKAPEVSDVVSELERDLAQERGQKWRRRLVVLGLLASVVFGIAIWRQSSKPPPEPRFITAEVSRRDVIEIVQSTGNVRPVTEVQVGAQVSGRVVKVLVDFNSKVKAGDLLAEIDPSVLGAQVSQAGSQLKAAKANRASAEARLRTAKINLQRMKSLRKEGIASATDLDQAQGQYAVAVAELASSKAQVSQLGAQLKSARTTLTYTRIYSPIDGVVINRAIEPGQTVAASFSAPVLFVIAQDLSKMQVLADIDEADVGKLSEGLLAHVVVDAFVGQKFRGKVSQIRYAPNNVQGVVTYSAVVDVSNPELKLRPGMTATVSIRTKEALKTLAVRNAALRFKPLPKKDEKDGQEGTSSKKELAKPGRKLKHGQGRIYQIVGGDIGQEEIAPKVIEIGVTDGIWTELRGQALTPKSQVVVEERSPPKKKRFGLF